MLSRKMWVRYQSFDKLKQRLDFDSRDWLSVAELSECERFREEGRLRQWLAGRFVAKQLLREQLVPWCADWRELEILSRDVHGRAVRPQVRILDAPQTWCLSISHSRRGVLVAVSLDPEVQVGVDLAEVEDLNPRSLVFWFSANERQRLREGDARHAAVCWAVKEAVYKAVNTGESFVPKKFEVFPQSGEGYDCRQKGQSLKDRSRITVWDVDGHVAVTAIVSESVDALKRYPHMGGSNQKRLLPVTGESVLAGIS
jgi:phosphopantetheinyl transferase